MTVSKSQPKAATKNPIVPLEGGNSMNAKKGYSSHSPNSPLRGYEGVRGSGNGAVRNGTVTLNCRRVKYSRLIERQ